VAASLPDVQFGLTELKDYGEVNYNGQPEEGGYDIGSGNVPWTLIAPISANQAAINEGLLKLEAEGGGDGPEAYGRALYETDLNPAVGWRAGARGVIVLIADNIPHDNELNEGIPPELFAQPSPFNTGPDPGPDNTLGTGDDLDWQNTVLTRLALDGHPLEYVDYQGSPEYFPYWQQWVTKTGGSAIKAEEGESIVNPLVAAIKAGASAALPPCPPGLVRDTNGKCAAPPSNSFKYEPRISCSKGCHVVIVKLTFDSAGNLIGESIPEEEGKTGRASASAKKGKGCKGKAKGKAKGCKPKPQFKKVEQSVTAGTNAIKLKLTGTAYKQLKKTGKLKLKASFTFTPTGGFPNTTKHTYKVKLPKKSKKGKAKAKGHQR
jgi:hypothetical protein